ncbi:MAG: hypothetical protein ACR2QC_01975 [Gammaproteobacteria bacterium]
MSDELHTIFMEIFEAALLAQKQSKNHWRHDSRFARVRIDLQLDSRGQMGEEFVAAVLRQLGHSVKNKQTTDPQNKQWDLVVDDTHRWEIKTATMGKSTANFQHENIYRERDYHGIVFVDIAPDDLYVSFVPKHEIPWKNLHRRKDSNFYKWDFSRSRIEDAKMTSLADFARGYAAAVSRIDSYLQKRRNPHDI